MKIKIAKTLLLLLLSCSQLSHAELPDNTQSLGHLANGTWDCLRQNGSGADVIRVHGRKIETDPEEFAVTITSAELMNKDEKTFLVEYIVAGSDGEPIGSMCLRR